MTQTKFHVQNISTVPILKTEYLSASPEVPHMIAQILTNNGLSDWDVGAVLWRMRWEQGSNSGGGQAVFSEKELRRKDSMTFLNGTRNAENWRLYLKKYLSWAKTQSVQNWVPKKDSAFNRRAGFRIYIPDDSVYCHKIGNPIFTMLNLLLIIQLLNTV